MVLDDVGRPGGAVEADDALPLLMASRRMSEKPSKRELRTNSEASAMAAPMSSDGPSRVTTSPSSSSSICASRRFRRGRSRTGAAASPGVARRRRRRRGSAGRSPSGRGSGPRRRPFWLPDPPWRRRAPGPCCGCRTWAAARRQLDVGAHVRLREGNEHVEARVEPTPGAARGSACSGSSATRGPGNVAVSPIATVTTAGGVKWLYLALLTLASDSVKDLLRGLLRRLRGGGSKAASHDDDASRAA